MNERIKELAEQAGFQWLIGLRRNNPIITGQETTVQEFAELIVQECVDLLMKPEYAMNNPTLLSPYNEGWASGRLLGIEHIKQHFGVKE
jgi:hypothetical protein